MKPINPDDMELDKLYLFFGGKLGDYRGCDWAEQPAVAF